MNKILKKLDQLVYNIIFLYLPNGHSYSSFVVGDRQEKVGVFQKYKMAVIIYDDTADQKK